ncbi:hypothetical protein ACWGR4_42800 [Embleya sp. NPDC055664]|uniref:hypothetical protein n=1 Tax=Embleya sp. NPDC059237 TaxID=3346784 RepID=UPI0036875121
MKRAVDRMGDRLLSLVMREERAGACVEYVNQLCYCYLGYQWRYNCNGVCTYRQGYPC